MESILLIAALETELCAVGGADGLVCGVGPVEAALSTATALAAANPPTTVVNVGMAGARSLAPGRVVIGAESVYSDVLDPEASSPRVARLAPPATLLTAATFALPEAVVAPIATTGRVGGGVDCDVEAMEGFGVLRAADAAGVAAIELRVIANSPDETDRARWSIAEALAGLHAATRTLVDALAAGG